MNPKEAKYYYHRGVLVFQKEEYQKAKDDFTVAVSLESNHAYAYNDRGSANLKLDDLDAAIADYIKATELNPNLDFAFNNLGSALPKERKIRGCD